MIKPVTRYQDSSGKDHTTEYDAHVADLSLLLCRTTHVNEGQAKHLVKWLVENRKSCDDFIEGLGALHALAPEEAVAVNDAPDVEPIVPDINQPVARDIEPAENVE